MRSFLNRVKKSNFALVMPRLILFYFFIFSLFALHAQTTNNVDQDSTFKVFPNPSHNQLFVTTEGRVNTAMIITSNGGKRYEYTQFEILSYQNHFGFGCPLAGCPGANVPSNFICTLERNNLEDGLYYLVLLDDLGHIYHTIIVYN